MVQDDHQLMEFGSDDSSVLSRNTSTRESPMLISNSNYHVIYRLVLTGDKLKINVTIILGPCSGKTTGQTQVHNWNMIELRDNRYNHVIHLVTAADGAEEFYENSPIRTEGIELAREMDKLTMQAWNGHPCFDIIDNSTDFNTKMRKMISLVCRRLNINVGDRLKMDNTHTEMLHGTKASK
ncbi:hypothetical protein BLOT_004058 [Blomia tropicalis]|nr:hypothetical protein BLOT_004058 [Blomia tropicalis]